MELYKKYRPKTFEEVYGNEETKYYFMNKRKHEIPHTILLYGPSGCGKTTIARIIATNKLGCVGDSLKEVDAADLRGIDTVREIIKKMQFMPMEGSCTVWVIDECHMLTKDAMSAFLKTLEDTPKHVYFILCTTDPQKLLPTIRGRCDSHQLNTLDRRDMLKLLFSIVKREGKTVSKHVLDQVVQDGLGQPRDSIQILNQVIDLPEDRQLEAAKRFAAQKSQIIELCNALMDQAPWKKVSKILKNIEQDPEQIRRSILGICNSILLNRGAARAAVIMECFEEPTYNIGAPGITLSCYRATIS